MGYMLLKEKASFMSLIIICAVFSIYLINPVSAEGTTDDTSENLGCCEMTNSGESCRYTDIDSCDSSFKTAPYQRCEDSFFCKVGCCISPDGTCSKQVSKATCENAGDGYTWDPDASCSMSRCQKGCCVLGGVECKYTTAKRCSGITADFEGLELDFRNAITSEQECTNICKQEDDGCCVKDTGECVRTTRAMCGLEDGTGGVGFYKDVFCSHEQLQSSCDPKCKEKAKMGCVEGLEDVYWFDSCGNREGVVTEPIENSDNPEGNGDCDYPRGTLCSAADKDHPTAYCKSVNCKAEDLSNYPQIDYDGVNRYNGESWCVYDSKPGPASDTVGSRHWRHICINGEEVVEPCKDYREEMCAQMDITGVPPDYVTYREAGCIANNAKTCSLDCNTLKEADTDAEKEAALRNDKKCCESISRSCRWQYTNAEETEGICMPIIPAGIPFWGDEDGNVDAEAKELCNSWNTETETIWAENAFAWCPESCDGKGVAGERRWDVTGRGEVYTNEALRTNNLLCNSAGDCGAKYSYTGKFNNDGYYRSWDKDAPFTTEQSAIFGSDDFPVKKRIEETNLDDTSTWEYLITNVGNGIYGGKKDYSDISVPGKQENVGTFESGGLNHVGYAITWTVTALTLAVYLTFATVVAVTVIPLSTTFTSFFALGLAGLEAAATTAEAAVSASVIPIVGWVVTALLLAATAILLAIIYSAGEETRMVTTTCEPWMAPVGGDDCGKCDEDPMHPCSEYRCRSLGQLCRFIAENEGTTKGTCYNEDPNDVTRPNIKPWYAEDGQYPLSVWKRERTSEGPQRVEVHSEYQINVLPSSSEYSSGYEIRGKLPSFSTIEFGIRTDNKPSQCKYSTEYKPDMTFATAGSWFGDNYYSKEHNMTIFGLLPNKTYTYYIICRGANGYPREDERTPPFKITFETGEGPDLEPPFIVGSEPENNGYIKAGENAGVLFYVDEVSPFKCRMATADMDYSLMNMNLSCASHTAGSLLNAYGKCAANMTLQQGVNTYYIRCRDEPTTGTTPNVMEESYVYSVIQSEPLEITSVQPPSGTTYYTRNITMQVSTAKGAFSGKAICSYEETTTRLISGEFFQTDAASHLQEFSGLPTGDYKFLIDCYDAVDNAASATLNFSVEADTIPPNVIALYKDAAGLHLTLDEEASCEYSNDRFTFGSGTSASTDSTTAVFPATMSKYYIICRDKFGNAMPEIIVKTEV